MPRFTLRYFSFRHCLGFVALDNGSEVFEIFLKLTSDVEGMCCGEELSS